MLTHKSKIKRSHAKEWRCSSWNSLVLESERPDNIYRTTSPLDYWKHYYKDSENKRYAKRTTNRAIRNQFRDKVRIMDFEESPVAMHGAQYQYFFDYGWFVY